MRRHVCRRQERTEHECQPGLLGSGHTFPGTFARVGVKLRKAFIVKNFRQSWRLRRKEETYLQTRKEGLNITVSLVLLGSVHTFLEPFQEPLTPAG